MSLWLGEKQRHPCPTTATQLRTLFHAQRGPVTFSRRRWSLSRLATLATSRPEMVGKAFYFRGQVRIMWHSRRFCRVNGVQYLLVDICSGGVTKSDRMRKQPAVSFTRGRKPVLSSLACAS
nr:hypothetical protein CFP56_52302 [Quercus suber]